MILTNSLCCSICFIRRGFTSIYSRTTFSRFHSLSESIPDSFSIYSIHRDIWSTWGIWIRITSILNRWTWWSCEILFKYLWRNTLAQHAFIYQFLVYKFCKIIRTSHAHTVGEERIRFHSIWSGEKLVELQSWLWKKIWYSMRFVFINEKTFRQIDIRIQLRTTKFTV